MQYRAGVGDVIIQMRAGSRKGFHPGQTQSASPIRNDLSARPVRTASPRQSLCQRVRAANPGRSLRSANPHCQSAVGNPRSPRQSHSDSAVARPRSAHPTEAAPHTTPSQKPLGMHHARRTIPRMKPRRTNPHPQFSKRPARPTTCRVVPKATTRSATNNIPLPICSKHHQS